VRRTWIGVAALLVALGCGSDSGDGDGDGDGDADAGFSDNELGRTCTLGVADDCPADHSCQVRDIDGASDTEGYCSPMCDVDLDCASGYAGPGTPLCFSPPDCVIVCETECPAGLDCLFTGGAVNVCAVAQ
jgi:hypothetical protein